MDFCGACFASPYKAHVGASGSPHRSWLRVQGRDGTHEAVERAQTGPAPVEVVAADLVVLPGEPAEGGDCAVCCCYEVS